MLAVLGAWPPTTTQAPPVLVEACRLALKHPEADFVSVLTNRKDLPLECLEMLDQKWAGGEDWSLSVISMHNATRPMLEKALPRWYEEEGVAAAIEKMRPLEGAAWWQALARSERKELRDAAAWNVNTPPELLLKLIDDPDESVAAGRRLQPALLRRRPGARWPERAGLQLASPRISSRSWPKPPAAEPPTTSAARPSTST